MHGFEMRPRFFLQKKVYALHKKPNEITKCVHAFCLFFNQACGFKQLELIQDVPFSVVVIYHPAKTTVNSFPCGTCN
jgi:hypothetical protein